MKKKRNETIGEWLWKICLCVRVSIFILVYLLCLLCFLVSLINKHLYFSTNTYSYYYNSLLSSCFTILIWFLVISKAFSWQYQLDHLLIPISNRIVFIFIILPFVFISIYDEQRDWLNTRSQKESNRLICFPDAINNS